MKVKIGPHKENRKIDIKIDKYDTWNMDHTLALIIHPMLVQLQETKHGSPEVDPKHVPEKLRPTKGELRAYAYDGKTDDNFHERWTYVLGEMIWAFSKLIDDENHYLLKEDEELRLKNGLKLFGIYFRSLWD